MKSPARKYLSEFAVSLYSGRFLAVTPSELLSGKKMNAEQLEISTACHIYLICRRPASAYDPGSFSYEDSRMKGNLTYKINGKSFSIPFNHEFFLLDGAQSVRVSAYPHRDIETLSAAGDVIRHFPSSMMSLHLDQLFREFEVLYVGQAFAEGKRSAIDRLKSHATLQKILADMQHNLPDDELMLLAFEYVPYAVIASFDGIDKTAIRDESDTKRFLSIMDNPLNPHQQICLAEAGLIRYFRPKYNEIYKDSFPASDQKILDQCYELDFSGLVVEIDTEEVGFTLRAPAIKASGHHIAQFDLVDPAQRRSFFTFVGKDGKSFGMEDVIPPSR